MKFLLSFFILVSLLGCETNPPKIVVEKEYIVRTAPSNLKKLPEYPESIDLETANQIDLSNWILLNEERQWKLESMINELIKFYEAPIPDKK